MFSNDQNIETIGQLIETLKHYIKVQGIREALRRGKNRKNSYCHRHYSHHQRLADLHPYLPELCRCLCTGTVGGTGRCLLHHRRHLCSYSADGNCIQKTMV